MEERFGPDYDERWLAVPFFLYNCAGCVTITVYLPTILRKGYFLIVIFNFGCPTLTGVLLAIERTFAGSKNSVTIDKHVGRRGT